jgi:hypothetical protein
MKKLLPMLVIGIMVVSGLGAAAIQSPQDEQVTDNIEISRTVIPISEPTFTQEQEFITLELEESETFLSISGKPMLPVITRTYSFPAGTRIDEVSVDMTWNQLTLDQKITPTPVFVPYSVEVSVDVLEEKKVDETVYESTAWYPEEPYRVKFGAGIEDGEQVIFVNIQCNPQYAPARDLVKVPKDIEIEINYENPTMPQFTADEYDLLIITHPLFAEDLQPLVDHKNSHGMRTIMETTDNIYANYQGVADWEEVKLFIADAIVDYGIEYVLLGGGHMGQTHDWYMPDFRSNDWNRADAYDPPYDETFSCDLYFADVFRPNPYGFKEFDDWDTNNNGIYGEGPQSDTGTDMMDLYPDVYVGRLPFRYSWEVPIAVNKIIDYENNAQDSWYKRVLIAAGDGFPTERYPGQATPGIYEGEIVGDVFVDLMERAGFTGTKCYLSDEGDVYVEDARDVYNTMNDGYGWVHMTGHASPFILGSYHPNVLPLIAFYTGFNVINFDNDNKLSFMICEGCHNAEFDVTTQELISMAINEDPNLWVMFGREEWIHHDASSWFVLHKNGGAIGVIGNTALGLGGLNEGCTRFVGGWIMLRFAEAYAVDGMEHTGTVWNVGISEYINTFEVNKDYGDRKTVEERALIGDPSIKLGGYGSAALSEEPVTEQPVYGVAAASAPTWSKGDSWTYRLDNVALHVAPDFEEIGRSIDLELSMGDIVMEVTDVTSNAYVTSVTSDSIDVTFGLEMDFHEPAQDEISIPTITLENVALDGELIVDKDNLGIMDINIDITVEVIENLENLQALIPIQLPGFIDFLLPYMSIPAVIELDIEFDEPYDLLDFPLENEKYWHLHANTVTVTIGGSVESVWLRILDIVNRFIPIIPAEFAQFLPNIDISEILEYYGIPTEYVMELPDVNIKDTFKTKILHVWGTESVRVPAGTFNAVHVSVMEDNGVLHWSEDVGNVVKLQGYLSDYIPFVDDLNLELIDSN